MNKNKQQGFSVIEALLILIIVGIIGFVGWYVWNSQNKTNKLLDNATNSSYSAPASTKKKSSSTSPSSTTDPTANWKAYSNKDGKFSLKYPSAWVVADNSSLCAPDSLLLGGNADSVGKCGSDSGGQISISSIQGDNRSKLEAKDGYINITSQSITVGGVSGVKETAIASGQNSALGALPDGTKIVNYLFYTNDRTYTLHYEQLASYPDILSDFDLMVTKTLQFHS